MMQYDCYKDCKKVEFYRNIFSFCSFPNCNSQTLNVHHIIPLSKGGYDLIDEYICLCGKHHKGKIHSEYQKKKNMLYRYKIRKEVKILGFSSFGISEREFIAKVKKIRKKLKLKESESIESALLQDSELERLTLQGKFEEKEYFRLRNERREERKEEWMRQQKQIDENYIEMRKHQVKQERGRKKEKQIRRLKEGKYRSLIKERRQRQKEREDKILIDRFTKNNPININLEEITFEEATSILNLTEKMLLTYLMLDFEHKDKKFKKWFKEKVENEVNNAKMTIFQYGYLEERQEARNNSR